MPRKPKAGRGQNGIPWFRTSHNYWVLPGDPNKRAIEDQDGNKIRGADNRQAAMKAWLEMHAKDQVARSGMDNSIADVLDSFAGVLPDRVKTEQTRFKYITYFRLFVDYCWSVGVVRVRDLHPDHVRQWWASRTTWGPSMKALSCTALKSAFRWASESDSRNILPLNPLSGLRPPTMLKRTRSVVVSEEQFRAAIARAPSQNFRDLLTVLWESGTRPSDLCRLTVADVDPSLEFFVLDEHKTAHRTGRPRTVVLPDEVFDIIQRLVAGKKPEDLVFTTVTGIPWSNRNIADQLGTISKRMGLKGKLIPYSARHSFVTRHLEGNTLADYEVAGMTGHSVKTLHDRYSHVAGNPSRLRARLRAANAKSRAPEVAPTGGQSDAG